MEKQPIVVSLNINLTELPKCPCSKEGGGGVLLPVMDIAREAEGNAPILKGWFCPYCNTFYAFVTGDMRVKAITPLLNRG